MDTFTFQGTTEVWGSMSCVIETRTGCGWEAPEGTEYTWSSVKVLTCEVWEDGGVTPILVAIRSSGKGGPAYIQVTLTEVQAVKEDLKPRRKRKGDGTELCVGVGSENACKH